MRKKETNKAPSVGVYNYHHPLTNQPGTISQSLKPFLLLFQIHSLQERETSKHTESIPSINASLQQSVIEKKKNHNSFYRLELKSNLCVCSLDF